METDPATAFAQGMELLRNPDGRGGFVRGVRLVEAAATQGHPDALERLALFDCMGIDRPQSWPRALDRLQQAAAHGSASARRQLLLLSDPLAATDTRGEAPRDDWGDIRSSIATEALARGRPAAVLSNAPPIRTVDSFASAAECEWLIERARGLLKPATIIRKTGEQTVGAGRTNSSAQFTEAEMDLVLEAIRTRISATVGVPLPAFEVTQILHYAAGQEFRPHCDFLDPSNPAHVAQIRSGGQRLATFLVYLNDGFDGGETEFCDIGLKFRGRRGDAIFWANVDRNGQPIAATRHAGVPPLSGEKWILSQWIRDRAPGPASAD